MMGSPGLSSMEKAVDSSSSPAMRNAAPVASCSSAISGQVLSHARRQYYLHERGTDLHGAKGETERHRGSYWGQNAIADHKDELEKFAHDAAKQFLGGNK